MAKVLSIVNKKPKGSKGIGWIKIHRTIQRSEMVKKLTSKQRDVMLQCLLLANFNENTFLFGNRKITCKPGQFITSIDKLKTYCAPDVNHRSIKHALKKLEDWGFIESKNMKNQARLITILKWEDYQKEENPFSVETNFTSDVTSDVASDVTSDVASDVTSDVTASQVPENKEKIGVKNNFTSDAASDVASDVTSDVASDAASIKEEYKEEKEEETKRRTATEISAPKEKTSKASPKLPNPAQEYLEVAKRIMDYQKGMYPNRVKNTKDHVLKTADVLEKLVKLDRWNFESQVKPALRWAIRDDFWRNYLYSLLPLRSKSKNGLTRFHNIYNQYERQVGIGENKGVDFSKGPKLVY